MPETYIGRRRGYAISLIRVGFGSPLSLGSKRERMGGVAPHPFSFVFVRETAVSAPQTGGFLGPTLKYKLGRTYGRILDFSFGGRTENGHEMLL